MLVLWGGEDLKADAKSESTKRRKLITINMITQKDLKIRNFVTDKNSKMLRENVKSITHCLDV